MMAVKSLAAFLFAALLVCAAHGASIVSADWKNIAPCKVLPGNGPASVAPMPVEAPGTLIKGIEPWRLKGKHHRYPVMLHDTHNEKWVVDYKHKDHQSGAIVYATYEGVLTRYLLPASKGPIRCYFDGVRGKVVERIAITRAPKESKDKGHK